jgi:SAM-dependent methyltransferase
MVGNREYYRDNYLWLLPDDRKAPILDLGCGEGDFSRFLSECGYRNVTAVDRNASAIAALKNVPGINPRTEDIGADTIEPRGWALIVAKQVIYYFDRRQAPAVVAAMRDALATDGRLIVEIFNGALISGQFTELKDPGILTAYTELGLRRLLEQNGFVVESISGAKIRNRGLQGALYATARALWFRIYRWILILERGFDDELPQISSKIIIAVARRA